MTNLRKTHLDDIDYSALALRSTERFSQLYTADKTCSRLHFFCQSSDDGVVRNNGRRGALFAPQVLLSQWKNFSPSQEQRRQKKPSQWSCDHWPPFLTEQSFAAEQEKLTKLIALSLSDQKLAGKTLVQLGGGHDHLYPFAKALLLNNPKMNIRFINLDAHADTRTDSWAHSGTPFRQLGQEFPKRIALAQYGLHDWANPLSNYDWPHGDYQVLTCSETEAISDEKWRHIFTPVHEHEIVFLSLDSDAVDGASLRAVSAVNARGLKPQTVQRIFHLFASVPSGQRNPKIAGIYEYNPLFDGLDLWGAKFLSSLLYELHCVIH